MKLESNACLKTHLTKELNCDTVMQINAHEMDTEITIKNEAYFTENTSAEVKLELEEEPSISGAHLKNGFVFVSLDSVTESNKDSIIDDKRNTRISVKKEPCSHNTVSAAITISEGSPAAGADMQEGTKDIPSDVNKTHQESSTETSRWHPERVCSYATALSTNSTSAVVERNNCSKETDVVLGSKMDSVIYNDGSTNVRTEIKDPLYLEGTSTEIKLEIEEPSHLTTHLVSASSNSAVDSENKIVLCKDDSELHMKVEIKEETWLDASEPTASHDVETDWQGNIKNCTSDTDETYQELSTQKPRLHREIMCSGMSTFPVSPGCLRMKEHSPGSEETGMYSFHRNYITEEYHEEKHVKILGSEFPFKAESFEGGYDFVSQKKSNVPMYNGENTDASNISNNKVSQTLPLKTSEKKRYKCNICGKSFNRIGHLKEHNLFHEGKKLHKCETCTKSFTRTSDLKKHTLIHKGERVQCKICGKDFSRATYLKTHAVIHEGKMPHKCKICEKSFTTAFTLKRHNLVHEDKRLYLCKICDKSFTTTSYLKKHSLSHKGISSHKCNICEKSFMWASGLKKHNRIHEGKGHRINIVEKKSVQDNKNNT